MTKEQLLALMVTNIKSDGIPSLTRGVDLREFETEVINAIFAIDNHSHLNKTTLDTYSRTQAQLDAFIEQKISDLVGGAPELLNTLGEIADQLEDDQDTITQLLTAISLKVAIADIIDNLSSSATDKPLSANQGKVLDGKITTNTTAIQTNTTAIGTLASLKTALKTNLVAAINELYDTLKKTVNQYDPLEVVSYGQYRAYNENFFQYIFETPAAGITPVEGSHWHLVSKEEAQTAVFAQTTGQSTTIGMSQKAITDLLFLSSGVQAGTSLDLAIKYQTRSLQGTRLNISSFLNAALGRRVRLEVTSSNKVLTGTMSNNGNGTVTGVGTLFLTELTAGQTVEINGLRRLVTSISSNTVFNSQVWGTGNGFNAVSGTAIDGITFSVPGATFQYTGFTFADGGLNIVEIECIAPNKYEIFITPLGL